MPKLSLGLGVQNLRKVGGAPAPTEPTAVLISDAGTATSNGNYVWDGVSFSNGKRLYTTVINSIHWNGSEWLIEDTLYDDNTYSSSNLITWVSINGSQEPPPTGTLSYS